MKNTPTDGKASAAWLEALTAHDKHLRRRGAAEKTRRAYGVDTDQFARWATAARIEPRAVEPRHIRRYAAALSDRHVAPATLARKLASLRSLFGSLVEQGILEQNPADLIASPKRPRNLPRVL